MKEDGMGRTYSMLEREDKWMQHFARKARMKVMSVEPRLTLTCPISYVMIYGYEVNK
jgi:hypothetical protein